MLSCSCDDLGDPEWWYGGTGEIAPLATKRMRRCCSCKDRIAVGDDCRAFPRWRNVSYYRDPEVVVRIYGEGGEMPLPTWYLCDRCAGLYESLDGLGFCGLLGQDLREACREYADMQRAAAERLAFEQWYDAQPEGRIDPWDVWQAAALLRELAAEPVQEPVGWLHDETGDFEPSHKPWMDDDEEWVPLYAAPQQPMHCPKDGGECGAGGYCRPEPVQRRPLTDKEIIALLAWDDYMGGCITLLDFARAIERAHGITGEPT